MLSWLTIILLAIASFFTASLSATVGMGGGIVLLSVMTFFMPIGIIIPVHGIVQLVSNVYRAFLLRANIVYPMFFYFCLGLPFGTLISVFLIKKIDNPKLALVFIAIFIFYGVFKPKKLPHFTIAHWAFSLLGLIVGIMGPLVGATGPILATFFLRDDMNKQQVVATKASVQVVGHLVKIPTFLYLGFDYVKFSPLIITMALVTFFGTRLGIHILGKVRENQFKIIFKTALFAAGLRVIYKIIYL